MIDWQNKSHARDTMKGDVQIKFAKDRKDVVIKIRKEVYLKLTDTHYLIVGFEGSRLYFQQANKDKGWKVADESKTVLFSVPFTKMPLSRIEEGDYNLEYDTNHMLYYIDVKNKITINWRMK